MTLGKTLSFNGLLTNLLLLSSDDLIVLLNQIIKTLPSGCSQYLNKLIMKQKTELGRICEHFATYLMHFL